MARLRRRLRRDVNNITRRRLPRPPLKGLIFGLLGELAKNRPPSLFEEGGIEGVGNHEDRRLFHPLGETAPAVATDRRRMSYALVPNRSPSKDGSGQSVWKENWKSGGAVAFAVPSRTVICLRRSARREVMHANGYAGSAGMRPARFNWMSQVSCRVR